MYTDAKLWAAIRRRVIDDGESIKAVSRRAGISRNMVRKMLRQAAPAQYHRPVRRGMIADFVPVIDAMLAEDEQHGQDRLRSSAAIFRQIQAEHGYSGSYSAVHRYCRSVQSPQILATVSWAAGENGIEALNVRAETRSYRLMGGEPKADRTRLVLKRDWRSERQGEVSEWIAQLQGDRLATPIRGEPEVIAKLLQHLHVPQRRRRNRVIVALAHEQGFPVRSVSRCLGLSRNTCRRYVRIYQAGGTEELLRPERRGAGKAHDDALKAAVFRILHEPPLDHGFNRTSWIMRDLREALAFEGFSACPQIIRRIFRDAGWKWRKARVALTSNDPEYREKLCAVQEILIRLGPDEAFFSIDEFGPFAVKMQGGRSLQPPGEQAVVPQWQKSKGCMIMTAALELSANQVTHFYSVRKNTAEMIRMMEVLLRRYADRRTLFLSWDAASWHMSKALFAHINEHNANAATSGLPRVETAPLPAGAQFLNVIESVFSGMARAVIHNSNYPSVDDAAAAIDRYFAQRNDHFRENPKRAGKAIWGKELVPPAFSSANNCKDPRWCRT